MPSKTVWKKKSQKIQAKKEIKNSESKHEIVCKAFILLHPHSPSDPMLLHYMYSVFTEKQQKNLLYFSPCLNAESQPSSTSKSNQE